MAMEEEFSIEIPDEDADGIQTVDNAVECAPGAFSWHACAARAIHQRTEETKLQLRCLA